MLTGKAKEDFTNWFLKNWNTYPPDNLLRDWLEDDVMKCTSLFFGYTINTINKLKKANEIYNQQH